MPQYVAHICTHEDLWDDLPSLSSQVLVCDCPWQDLCEADLLAGLVFEATSPVQPEHQSVSKRSRKASSQALVTALAASRVVTVQSCPVPPQPFCQESVVLAFRKLFPEPWLQHHRFPMLEDLLNQPPFTCYGHWRFEEGLEWDGPLNPCMAGGAVRLAMRMAEGKQAGALSQRAALPPLLPFGLDPDDHFTLAVNRASLPLPTESLPVMDDDLKFAGTCLACWRGDLRRKREQALGAMKELKSRLASTTALLARHQTEAIQQVTQGRDLALVTLLILMMSWGDTGYPFGLIILGCRHPATTCSPLKPPLGLVLLMSSTIGNPTIQPSCGPSSRAKMMHSYCHKVPRTQNEVSVHSLCGEQS